MSFRPGNLDAFIPKGLRQKTSGVEKPVSIKEGKAEKKFPKIFKVEISGEDFDLLSKKFNFKEPKTRSYVYFDTNESSKEAKLFHNGIRLRAAIRDSKYFLELKKNRGKNCEIAMEISPDEFQSLLNGVLPEGNVKNKLIELNSLLPLKLVGKTTSTTQKTKFHDGQLILDQTSDGSDSRNYYHAEYRADKVSSVDDTKQTILKELGIPDNLYTISKLRKFWENRL